MICKNCGLKAEKSRGSFCHNCGQKATNSLKTEKMSRDTTNKLIFNLAISLLCYIALHSIGYFIGEAFIGYERVSPLPSEEYRRSFESVMLVAILPFAACYGLGRILKDLGRPRLNFLSISGIFVFALIAQNIPQSLVTQSGFLSFLNQLPTVWLYILNIVVAPDRVIVWSIIVAIFPVFIIFCGMYNHVIEKMINDIKEGAAEEEKEQEEEEEQDEEEQDETDADNAAIMSYDTKFQNEDYKEAFTSEQVTGKLPKQWRKGYYILEAIGFCGVLTALILFNVSNLQVVPMAVGIIAVICVSGALCVKVAFWTKNKCPFCKNSLKFNYWYAFKFVDIDKCHHCSADLKEWSHTGSI